MPSLFSRRRGSVDTAAQGASAGPAPIKQEISMSTATTTATHGRQASVDSAASPGRSLFGLRRGSRDESGAAGSGGLAALKSKLAATGSRVNLPFGQHSNASFLSPSRNSERRGSVGSPASPTAAAGRDPREAIRTSGKRLSLVMHGEGDSPVGNENSKRRSGTMGAPPSAWKLAGQTGSSSAAPSIPAPVGFGGSLLDDDPLDQQWKPLEPTPVQAGGLQPPMIPAAKEERTSDDVDSGYGGSVPAGSEGSNSGGVPTVQPQPHGAAHEQSPLHGELVSENTTPTPQIQARSTERPSPQPTSPNPSRRPDLGTLTMPPSLTSRQSTMGQGMTIVPSTPMPRPIANLPTLIAAASVSGTAGTTRLAPGAQVPASPTAGMSRQGSQVGTPGAQGGNRETKWVRNAMPVMLREPSTRPAPPVEESDQEDSMSETDSDEEDSASETGTSDTDGASSEGHQAILAQGAGASPSQPGMAGIPRRGSRGEDGGFLGGVASRPLAPSKQHRRHRGSMGGSNVDAIHEEHEDEGEPANMTTLSDRRPAAPNRLGPLPSTGSSMSTATVRRAPQQPAWSLPTPSTPPANSPFASFSGTPAGPSGWTQFGAATPMAKTPAGLTFSPKPAVKQFAKVKELGKTPSVASPSLPAKGGYFDIPSEELKAGSETQAPAPAALAPSEAAAERSEAVAPLAPASIMPDDGPTPRPAATTEPMQVIGDVGAVDEAETSRQPAALAAPLAPPLGTVISTEPSQTPASEIMTPRAIAITPPPSAPVPAMMQPLNDTARAVDNSSPALPAADEDEISPAQPAEEQDRSRSSSPDTPPAGSGTSSAMPGESTADLGAAVMAIPVDPSSPPAVTAVASHSARRPGLYSQRSRSMIDLSTEASGMSTPDSRVHASQGSSYIGASEEPIRQDSRPRTPATVPDWLKPPPTPAAGFGGGAGGYFSPTTSPLRNGPRPAGMIRQESRAAKAGSPLKRTRSLQETRSALPEYAPPEPGSKFPLPREEEGREGLPQYWCHVHIEGYLPRKMEFSSPGVQSRDRSWKRLYFVLHGTALSVYKHDVHKLPLKDPSAVVPVVDANDAENLHVHLPGERRNSTASPTIVTSGGGGARRPSDAQSARASSEPPAGGVPGQGGRRGSTDMSITPAPANGPDGARRTSNASSLVPQDQDAKDAQLFPASAAASAQRARAASVASSTTAPNATTGLNAKDIAVHLPFHTGNSLVKQYSLQNAESGLAADYVKKKNVVRVRAAGEQFLLQTESAKEVVDWIEAFQAATNVALELDVRPMPKIITLPRRRRRRRPGDPPVPGQPATEDTPEGNARAVAAATAAQRGSTRGANSGAVDAMERMLAEDQAAGG